MTLRTLQPPGWTRPRGYANGIAAEGRLVFVAGQVGWDEHERIVSENLAAQAERALQNVVSVLAEGGARPRHIARMTWYVTDRAEYLGSLKALGQVYRTVVGEHYPAMSIVEVSALVEVGAKVEIEATAVVPHD
jgi:enamine deaminase RidA (YjgF/YER057c/UK114 family)